jgi:hypothetical protein
MEFVPKGLNPFKIQSDFELEYFFFNFVIQNPGRIGSWAKKDVCLFSIYPSTCQIWKFLELSKKVICIFETRALEFIGKGVNKRKRVNRPALCDQPAHLNIVEPSFVGNDPRSTKSPATCLSHAHTAPG